MPRLNLAQKIASSTSLLVVALYLLAGGHRDWAGQDTNPLRTLFDVAGILAVGGAVTLLLSIKSEPSTRRKIAALTGAALILAGAFAPVFVHSAEYDRVTWNLFGQFSTDYRYCYLWPAGLAVTLAAAVAVILALSKRWRLLWLPGTVTGVAFALAVAQSVRFEVSVAWGAGLLVVGAAVLVGVSLMSPATQRP